MKSNRPFPYSVESSGPFSRGVSVALWLVTCVVLAFLFVYAV